MIEIKDVNDIKIIRELAKGFSPDIDLESIKNSIESDDIRFKSLEDNYLTLINKVDSLTEVQKGCLIILDKVLKILEGHEGSIEKESLEKKVPVKKQRRVRNGDQVFTPYQSGREEYQLIMREDSNLVHVFTANEKNGTQKHLLPINIFELLIVVESYLNGERSLTNAEVNNFCGLFGITRAQFSKIYYNLSIGKFDGILAEIDKMIADSVFTFKKSHIYRNNHDVNIDKTEFKDLLNIYVNTSGNSFLTIYKLIKERGDIDPFDLLIMLKKSGHVSKALGE